MDADDPDLADLAAAQEATSRLLGGLGSLGAEAWGLPTPCSEWDVAGIVRHLVVGERAFALALGGVAYDVPTLSAEVAGMVVADLPTAFDTSRRGLLTALASAGPGTYPTGLGPMPAPVVARLRTVEALVHGWDVARGTGVALDVEGAVAERALEHSRALMARLPPGRTPFGPEQPVADDASVLDRLAGLLGRS